MRTNLLAVLVAAFAMGFCFSGLLAQNEQIAPEQKTTHETISVEAFQTKLAAMNGLLLDVRTPEEYQAGHLAGSLNINFYDEHFKEQVMKLAKEKPVFVYCASGRRSANTMAILQAGGFPTVFNLEGGIKGWKAAGLPVTTTP